MSSKVDSSSPRSTPSASPSPRSSPPPAPPPAAPQVAVRNAVTPPTARDSFQGKDTRMTANASPVLTGQSPQVAQAGGVTGPAAVQATPAYRTQKELSEKRQQLGKDMQELEMLNQMVSQAPLTVLFKGGRMDELGKRIDQTKKDIQGLEAVAATQPKEDVQRASFQVFNERLAALEAEGGREKAARLARQSYYNDTQFNASAGTLPASESELLKAGFPKDPLMKAPNGDVIDMGHVACALDWKVNPSVMNHLGADLDQVTLTGDLGAAAVSMGNGRRSAADALGREASPPDLYGDIDGLNLAARLEAQPSRSMADTLSSYYGNNPKNRMQEFASHSPYVQKDAGGQPMKDAAGNFVLDDGKLQTAAMDFAKELQRVRYSGGVEDTTLTSNAAQVVKEWKSWFDQEARRSARPRVS